MPASDKKIKHFVIIRFFSFDDPNYPHDIYDPEFLAKQLILAKNNALSSLDNQTNKNFVLVFILNDKFFDNPKYEFIFTELQNSTALPLTFIKNGDLPLLVNDACNDYDFVITSRMDLDDFACKDAVADTQSKVDECVDILAYGYCKGYMYIRGELYDTLITGGDLGHHSILQSVILQSAFAKKIPFVGAYTFNHMKIKNALKKFLEKNGVEFAERMFQQNISLNAFVYVRQEFSHYILTHHAGKPLLKLPKKKPLTTENITKEQLASEFGFHDELKSIRDCW